MGKDTKSSSVAFLVHNHCLLLYLRDNVPGIYAPGKWDLPGGHVQEGEREDEALKRELVEEIGIIPGAIACVGFLRDEARVPHFVYFSKLTDEEAGSVHLGREGQKLQLFSFHEFLELKLDNLLAPYLCAHFTEEGINEMLRKEVPVNAEMLGIFTQSGKDI